MAETKPIRVPEPLLEEADDLIAAGYRGVGSRPELVRDALRLYIDQARTGTFRHAAQAAG